MIDFFLKNYTWIFSGIGVVILTIIYQLYVRKKENKESSLKNTHISTKSGNNVILSGSSNNTVQIITNKIHESLLLGMSKVNDVIVDIDPNTIKEEINYAPAFQQDNIGNNYIGIKIRWNLELYSIRKNNGQISSINFYPIKQTGPLITIEADIEDYPFLKFAKRDSLFEVEGKIVICSSSNITIECSKIKPVQGINLIKSE